MKYFSRHLERWRNEPESRRARRTLVLAGGLTLCLFVLWLANFRLAAALRETSPAAAAVASPGIIERIKAGWRAIID